MIADIVISNYYFKLHSTRDTFLILQTSIDLSINITVPVILKRPSYKIIYAFIREGCFNMEKSNLAKLDKLLLNPEILICDKHKL